MPVDQIRRQFRQLSYICSPGNPTGAVTPLDELKKLIALADENLYQAKHSGRNRFCAAQYPRGTAKGGPR